MNRVEEKTVNIKKLSGGQRKSKRLRCNNLVDPWCQNRALYTQEAKRVEKKKTKSRQQCLCLSSIHGSRKLR